MSDNKNNTGDYNTGNRNTGDGNTGYRNTGYWNTGDGNTGDWNTGNYNTGNRNTGDGNTGYRNTGYWNTGNYNTGNRNTGDGNTGYRNTGDWNTGYWNTGDGNTGDWNTGNWNTGYCNSITPKDCLIFNKPAKIVDWENAIKPKWLFVDLTKWINENDMTNKEKEAYPSYVTTGGYLKVFTSLKAAYVDAWENATPEDRALTEKLPNFCPDVFAEVFGFNPFKKKTISLDGEQFEVSNDVIVKIKSILGENK